MMTAILVLAFMQPQAAEIDLRIDASKHSVYAVIMNGNEVGPGVYRSTPFRGEQTVKIIFVVQQGENLYMRELQYKIKAGERKTIMLEIPRVYPTVVQI